MTTRLSAGAPKRLDGNADGPLYVNDKCINCAACAQFAPTVFSRSSSSASSASSSSSGMYHVVHSQPHDESEILQARAAMAACPVAAIRTETNAQRRHRSGDDEDHQLLVLLTPSEQELVSQLALSPKLNRLPMPFPLRVSPNIDGIYFVGHHSEETFGAVPYLLETKDGHGWILVDTPKFSRAAVRTVESLTGPEGPSYMVLTHVDDTTGHNDWKRRYPHLRRIFHAGDLGRHNWLGDATLEDVEILLHERSTKDRLQFFTLDGTPIEQETISLPKEEVLLVHTPGHSPGSLTLWRRPTEAFGKKNDGVIFTGDTYAYTSRDGGRMSSFPRYGHDRSLQAQILPLLVSQLDWSLVAPGHGHVRDYTVPDASEGASSVISKQRLWEEMQPAIQELNQWSLLRR